MATQFTRYADQQVLNALFKGVALPNITWYLGGLQYAGGVAAGATPSRDNVVEVSLAANPQYARKQLGPSTLTPVNGQAVANIQNDAQALFDEAQTEWGNIVGIGLWDALQAGNLWIVTFVPINQQRFIRVGDRLTVPAKQITISGGAT